MSVPLFVRILEKYRVSPQGWTAKRYEELGHVKKPILSAVSGLAVKGLRLLPPSHHSDKIDDGTRAKREIPA